MPAGLHARVLTFVAARCTSGHRAARDVGGRSCGMLVTGCTPTWDGRLGARECSLSSLDARAVGAHGASQEVSVRQRRADLRSEEECACGYSAGRRADAPSFVQTGHRRPGPWLTKQVPTAVGGWSLT
jgi:hypothetical protein